MSFVGVPDYEQVNSAATIWQELGISHLLDKETLRRVEKALALLDENTYGLQAFLHGTSQSFPLLASDPSSPADGDVWINTSTDQAKIRKAGVTRVFTVV